MDYEPIVRSLVKELVDAKFEEMHDAQSNNSRYRSRSLGDLAAALSKAQGEYPVIRPNRSNTYFKSNYTDLDTILRAVRPVLSKNGLSLSQQVIKDNEGKAILCSILLHASGQYLESEINITPTKNDTQTYGSTLTYLRRYAATTLLGITTSADPADDDAEITLEEERYPVSTTINKTQLEELEYMLQDAPRLKEEIIEKMNIPSLAHLPQSKYRATLERVRELKSIPDGLK